MNTIQEKWEHFSKNVIPENAPKEQFKDMKNAFYAGAMVVLDIQYVIGSEGVSEDAAFNILDGLHEEVDQHIKDTREFNS